MRSWRKRLLNLFGGSLRNDTGVSHRRDNPETVGRGRYASFDAGMGVVGGAVVKAGIWVSISIFAIAGYLLWRHIKHHKELGKEEIGVTPKRTYSKYKTRPEQQEAWGLLMMRSEKPREVFILTPRRFGKDVLVAKRALEATNSLIVAHNQPGAKQFMRTLWDVGRDAGVSVAVAEVSGGYVAGFHDGSVAVTWPLALNHMRNKHNLWDFSYDFLCFLEAGLMSIQGPWASIPFLVRRDALVLCIGTCISRDSVFANRYRTSSEPIVFRFKGPLPNLPAKGIATLKNVLSPEAFEREIIGLWPKWLTQSRVV